MCSTGKQCSASTEGRNSPDSTAGSAAETTGRLPQRISPLATATVQHVGSSEIARAQQDVSSLTAGAQRAVSSSTAGAQRAVSPASRPRSLSAPAGTRGRGPGGFTLGKNITGWRDGPMGRFVKPMSAAAASDGAEAIEEARRARDARFSTKLSETLRKQRDESAGIKARTTLAYEFFVRQFKIRGGSGFGKGTGGGRPGKNDKLLSNRVGELAKQY